MNAHYSGPTYISGPNSFSSYAADWPGQQKWLVSLTVNDELAQSFGVARTTLPAVIDDFGNLVVVK